MEQFSVYLQPLQTLLFSRQLQSLFGGMNHAALLHWGARHKANIRKVEQHGPCSCAVLTGREGGRACLPVQGSALIYPSTPPQLVAAARVLVSPPTCPSPRPLALTEGRQNYKSTLIERLVMRSARTGFPVGADYAAFFISVDLDPRLSAFDRGLKVDQLMLP